MVVHVCDQRSLEPGEGPIAVVLAPTREIAVQVQKQVKPMIQALSGRSLVVTGKFLKLPLLLVIWNLLTVVSSQEAPIAMRL